MHRWISLLGLSILLGQPAGGTFTRDLWQANRDVYQEILSHPFLKGLTNGNLSREAFAFYMIQDAHYLREFARALSVTAAKAPREEWAALLNSHSADTFNYERRLHETIFKEYGITAEQVKSAVPAPEAVAYTNFLVATAYSRPFAESMAALLPCYWIYWEVGKSLQEQGSRDAVYQRWIEAYASPEYGQSVEAVLEMVEQVGAQADPATREQMRRHFRRSARYEWMFWDSAYHRRDWPPPLPQPAAEER